VCRVRGRRFLVGRTACSPQRLRLASLPVCSQTPPKAKSAALILVAACGLERWAHGGPLVRLTPPPRPPMGPKAGAGQAAGGTVRVQRTWISRYSSFSNPPDFFRLGSCPSSSSWQGALRRSPLPGGAAGPRRSGGRRPPGAGDPALLPKRTPARLQLRTVARHQTVAAPNRGCADVDVIMYMSSPIASLPPPPTDCGAPSLKQDHP